jgi:hypothetical protein
MGSLKSKIQELEDVKVARQRLWAISRWNQLGNIQCLKIFSQLSLVEN